MDVKICIKGDLEHNKKMADIIEDICPETHHQPSALNNIIHSKYFFVSDWSFVKKENNKDIEL